MLAGNGKATKEDLRDVLALVKNTQNPQVILTLFTSSSSSTSASTTTTTTSNVISGRRRRRIVSIGSNSASGKITYRTCTYIHASAGREGGLVLVVVLVLVVH